MAAMSALTQFGGTLVHAAALTNVSTNLDTLCQQTLGKPTSASPSAAPGLKVIQASQVSFPDSTQTFISWSSAPQNTDGMWSSGSTITVQTAGWYRIDLQVTYSSAAVSVRQASIYVNGTADPTNLAARHDESIGVTGSIRVQARLFDHFSVGDTIRGAGFQASGGTVLSDLNFSNCWMTCVYNAP